MPIRSWGDLLNDAGTAGNFDPIPAGDYDFVVSKAEAGQSGTQKTMYKCQFKVETPGPHQNRLVFCVPDCPASAFETTKS